MKQNIHRALRTKSICTLKMHPTGLFIPRQMTDEIAYGSSCLAWDNSLVRSQHFLKETFVMFEMQIIPGSG